jgi:hypothetical protein
MGFHPIPLGVWGAGGKKKERKKGEIMQTPSHPLGKMAESETLSCVESDTRLILSYQYLFVFDLNLTFLPIFPSDWQ